jgi:2-iminobutanoate/2-iminopropanoate deaminase
MKTNRRTMIKGLVAGAAGVAGLGLVKKAKAKAVYAAAKKSKYPDEPTKFTKIGNVIFASGFVCLPHEGERTLANHVKVSMGKLEAALKEAGSGLDKVYRITAWIDDIANYRPLDVPYRTAFPGGQRRGSRSCMAVPKGNIPGNSMCAFDAIAYI